MRRAGTALLCLVMAFGPLAACSADAPDALATGGSTGVKTADVAAPELAALRDRVGIDPCPPTDAAAPARDDGLPSLRLPCLGGGREVDLAQLRGVPTVVNLWASWCGPCRKELPLLQQLHERGGGRVRVIGVDFADDQPASALRLAAASGVTYALVADPQALLQTPLRVSGLPVTLLVDADGRMVYTKIGPFSSYQELASLVREHLGVSA